MIRFFKFVYDDGRIAIFNTNRLEYLYYGKDHKNYLTGDIRKGMYLTVQHDANHSWTFHEPEATRFIAEFTQFMDKEE